MIQKIDSKLFKNMIIESANYLEINENIINNLNVFPVPDADTGTNMYLTLKKAKETLLNIDNINIELNELLKINANALLRSAKGNSGSILSLIFRGFMKTAVKYNKNYLDCDILSKAFFYGTDLAYKAVINPVDGTMLTVCKNASKKCVDNCKNFKDVNDFFDYFIYEANEELQQTKIKNPVLKKAGVVDAGAFGFICILNGMKKALSENSKINLKINNNPPANHKLLNFFNDNNNNKINSNIKFIYCTEAIIQKINNNNSNFKNHIINLGDSIVVFEEDKIIKFHIHTNHPDTILSIGLKIGSLSCIKIENMKEQHTESHIINQNINNAFPTVNNIKIIFKNNNLFDLIINNKIELIDNNNFENIFELNIIKKLIEFYNKNRNIFTLSYSCLKSEDINKIIKTLKIYFPYSDFKIINSNIENEKYISISNIKKCI